MENKRAKKRQYLNPKQPPDPLTIYFQPQTMRECLEELDKHIPQEAKEEMLRLPDRSEMIRYHRDIGTFIRSRWGLWRYSPLALAMNRRGIWFADDMSHAILEYYYDWLQSNHESWQKFDAMPEGEYHFQFDGYTVSTIAGYAEGHLQYQGEKEQQISALISEVHRPGAEGVQNRANFRNREGKGGQGIGYGCWEVDSPEITSESDYDEWKTRWEEANKRVLEGYVWAIWVAWERGAGYMPHETLIKIIDAQEAIFARQYSHEDFHEDWCKLVDKAMRDFSLLTASERLWYTVESLIIGVCNGGIIFPYINYGAEHIHETIADLITLGFPDVADLLKQVNLLFPNGEPSKDIDKRNEAVGAWDCEHDEFLEKCGTQFYARCDALEAALLLYIQQYFSKNRS